MLAATIRIVELEAQVAGFEAARFAYASEFPLDEEGFPDKGSIHQNIRELKKQRDEALHQVQVLREALSTCQSSKTSMHQSFNEMLVNQALSEIPSPGVLCESEPVAWLSTDCIGERYLCFSKPNDKDSSEPLYRKKGETP
jgi:hypothetical protein